MYPNNEAKSQESLYIHMEVSTRMSTAGTDEVATGAIFGFRTTIVRVIVGTMYVAATS